MGHVITSEGLQADHNKIDSIVNMPPPTDKGGVQALLGVTNYVHRFAPGLADTTKPLRDLLKKDSAFVWDQTHEKALEEVKSILMQAPHNDQQTPWVQGSLRRAHEAFYWPNMNEQITEYMSKCYVCNSYNTEQRKEPMIYHKQPTRTWESIAVDLFTW